MSVHILSACWRIQKISPTQKLVLISLADQSNDHGVCWPSVSHIKERTCLSERAIRSAISQLSGLGLLSKTERTGRSTYYTITPAPAAPLHEAHPTPAPAAPLHEAHPTPAPAAPLPLHEAHPTPAPAAPITVIEPSLEPSDNQKHTQSVMSVFEHWKIRMNHNGAKLDDKRRKLIAKALKIGYTTDDLIAAIDGCAKSAFHMGQNDRGAVYDGLDLILRDASKIDGFIKNNSLTQQQGWSLNENSRNHDRISQLSKTAAGRMQLNIERELAEIQASRQRGDNTLVGSDEECVLAQVDFDVSGRRD